MVAVAVYAVPTVAVGVENEPLPQARAVIAGVTGPAAFTVKDTLQFCPPKLTGKTAVPAADGVPEIV